jgi:hypothetical protein
MEQLRKEFYDNESIHDLSIRLFKQSELLEEMIDKLGIDYFKWFIPYYIERVNKEISKNENEKLKKVKKQLKDIIYVINMNRDMFKEDYFEDVVSMLNKVVKELR